MKALYTRTFFRVVIPTEFGEKVAVVGSESQLGNWQVSRCHELVTNEDVVPAWFSKKPAILPLKKKVAYKYVVLNDRNEIVRWEEIEGNRELTPTGVEMLVEDDNGYIRGKTSCEMPVSLSLDAQKPESETDPTGLAEAQERLLSAQEGRVKIDQNDSLLVVALELPLRVVRVSEHHNSEAESKAIAAVAASAASGGAGVAAGGAGESSPVPQLRDGSGEPVAFARSASGRFELRPSKCTLLPSLFHLRRRTHLPVSFFGFPGVYTTDEEEKEEIRQLLEPYSCFPIFCPEKEMAECLCFCNQIMRPLFHNVLSVDSEAQEPYNPQLWSAYQYISKLYATEVALHMQETDIVWIHDFQLLVAPMYITRRNRRANIGLFLHVPFPSSEIFRCLPCREEILRGMLCADLIGFHFFEYARHFLVTCKRLLGLEYSFRRGGLLAIDFGGRSVFVRIGHVHVMYQSLEKALRESDCKQRADAIRRLTGLRKEDSPPTAKHSQASMMPLERHQGKFIFGSVDRCEPLAGLQLKIRALDKFLESYQYARGKVVLLQYAYPVRTTERSDERALAAHLLQLTKEVNDKYSDAGCDHIELVVKEVEWEERCSLFMAADCLLDSCIRDGLNLNPFEYYCCRAGEKHTAAILSEFTGCSRALASPIRANPWNCDAMAAAMDTAIGGRDNMEVAVSRDRTHLQHNNTLNWAEEFVLDLARARKSADFVYSSMGLGTTYRMMGMDSHFRYLDTALVMNAFRNSRHRVFFFDCEGTLAPDQRRLTMILCGLLPLSLHRHTNGEQLFAAGRPPSPQVQKCLKALLRSPKNTVVILSGRDRTLLEDWFRGVKGIGLCAEHGYYYRLDRLTGDEWGCMCPDADFTWKSVAMELMLQYVKRTQGSFIENKGSALVFQYRDADPDFVTVVSGKGYVEVKLLGVNKGRAVEKIMQTLTTLHGDIDFVLCIGDDRQVHHVLIFMLTEKEEGRSDEDMFAVINTWTTGEGRCLTNHQGPNSSALITHTGREHRPASQPLHRGSISSDEGHINPPSDGGERHGPSMHNPAKEILPDGYGRGVRIAGGSAARDRDVRYLSPQPIDGTGDLLYFCF
ncbi:trehalose-6-phosphate synthase domain-containing protein [Cyclospora cayetanensis]|uniref:Trehalose-6-phosphate synthase domain-containing protein n=1 Tax=Cyclospora cayetanensis TaxID=88456 RepID=A0A1D3D6R8_9EIME|nr:trehalose-6-phosphate synthase domain-containing protein [Cyclospora cayetanensis]